MCTWRPVVGSSLRLSYQTPNWASATQLSIKAKSNCFNWTVRLPTNGFYRMSGGHKRFGQASTHTRLWTVPDVTDVSKSNQRLIHVFWTVDCQTETFWNWLHNFFCLFFCGYCVYISLFKTLWNKTVLFLKKKEKIFHNI